jgi:hypothetical protein
LIAAGTATVMMGLVGAGAAAWLRPEPTATPTPTEAPPTVTETSWLDVLVITFTPTSTPTGLLTRTPTRTSSATPTPTQVEVVVTNTPTRTPTPIVRRMTASEVTLLLRAHVESQRAQFQGGQVRFSPPDRAIISGRNLVRGQSIPLEADLAFGVDANGRPRILSYRLTTGGQPAPPEAQAALAARVTQTNSELEATIPRGQRIRRVWTTPDSINAELAD